MESEESEGMASVTEAYWHHHHQQQHQQQQLIQNQQQHQHHHHSSHQQAQQSHHSHHPHHHQQQQQQHQQSQGHYLWNSNGHSHHHHYQAVHHQLPHQPHQHYALGSSSSGEGAGAAQPQQHYAQQSYQQHQVQLQNGSAGQAPPPQHHQQAVQYHLQRGATHCADRPRIRHYEQPGDPMITSSLKGKQGKDGPDEKKDADGELWGNVEAQAAFLGPNLWDKTLPYDADLKYVDLDEFLSENGIPVDGVAGGGGGGQGAMPSAGNQLHKLGNSDASTGGPGAGGNHQGPASSLHLEPVTKRERSPSPSDCCSPDTLNPPSPADSTLSMASSGRDFDPRTRAFSDEELKPQPMIKKSRKQFVPDDLKDDKYWARRRKNNMAAKRSRDARRMKENQIALRAGFLEKENMGLRQELDRLKNENMLLRDKLSKYTDV